MALDTVRPKSEQIRRIAKSQAELSRGGGMFLNNKDRIKLSHAFIDNTRLANREAEKEEKAAAKRKKNQTTDSNN